MKIICIVFELDIIYLNRDWTFISGYSMYVPPLLFVEIDIKVPIINKLDSISTLSLMQYACIIKLYIFILINIA